VAKLSPRTMNLEAEVRQIQERNKRVEADKAWETSLLRRACITVLTYVVILIFLLVVGFPNPYLSALVPAVGFMLSTLTLSYAKAAWVRNWEKKRTTA
jgi:hypothetical protein